MQKTQENKTTVKKEIVEKKKMESLVTRNLKFSVSDARGMAIGFNRVFRLGLTFEQKL